MAGRPSKYDPKFCKQVLKLSRLGATTQEIADFFEVHRDTVNEWANAHEEFATAMRSGKLEADAEVAHSLYRRAKGYSHKAIKIHFDKDGLVNTHDYIERYPPDTTACIFWLKNRQPDKWRDRQEVAVDSAKPIVFAYTMPDQPPEPPTPDEGEAA